MKKQTNKSYWYFVIPLLLFVAVMLWLLAPMADASVNIPPYTKKLRQGDVATNFAFIRGDTLFVDSMAVASVKVLKAVALQSDTLRGSSTVVGIVDDTLIVDTDSTGSAVTIRFGRWGGGLRWSRSDDKMQYSNNFSTWTDIGTGGAADTTDDSTAIIYSTDRVQPYSDTGIYIGAVGDETQMDFSRADTILAFIGIYYGEGVADSMLMSKGWIEGIVGDSVAGKLDGINSSNGISGSASEGTANIQLDPAHFAVGGDTAKIFDNNSGRLVFDVFGTPTNTNEMTITENNIEIRSAGSNGTLYLSGFDLERVAHVAVGSMYTSGGTSSAPTWQSIKTVIDSLTGTAIPLADSATGALRASLLIAPQGSNNTGGRLTLDSLFADTLFATRGNFTNFKLGTDVFLTDITGDGLAIAAGALTATLGTAITTGEVTDGTLLWADMDSVAGVKDYVRKIFADSAAATLANARTIGGNWVNTANPWADNEVANNLTVDDAGIASTITRDAELEDSLDAYLIATVIVALVEDSLDAYYDTTKSVARIREIIEDSLDNYYDSSKVISRIKELVRDSLFNNSNNFFKTAGNGLTSSTSTVNVVAGANGLTVNADSIYIDTTKVARFKNIKANWVTPWTDSTLNLGSAAGLTIGSSILLGTDITDDTVLITLPAEWAGAVLSRGYGTDSTKAWDSLTISGGSDIYGNYIQFAKTATTSGTPTMMRRNFQIAIPVPNDADSIYDVSVSYRVQDGTGAESSYVRLKWSTTPFDSSSANTYKLAYTDRDSSNSTTFDTLGVDYNRTYVTRGSKIYVLLTALLYDFHTTWARCYDVMVTYHRNRL